MSRTACFFAFTLALAASGACAADLPVKAPAPSASLFDWSGFYIGAHGGYGWGRDPFTSVLGGIPGSITVTGITSRGFVAGGQAGYNWQYGRVVAGLELDMSATGIRGGTSASRTGVVFALPAINAATVDDHFENLGTARARVGFLPLPYVLLYGTGGLGWTRIVQDTTTISGAGLATVTMATISASRFGWAGGFGAEATLAPWGMPSTLVRAEYIHYDFGTLDSATTATPGFAPLGTVGGSMTVDVVRGGLSFKFSGGG